MTSKIVHTKVATTPDDGVSEVGTNEWNDSHVAQFADGDSIDDDSAKKQIKFNKTASAVNYLETRNAATLNPPSLGANGTDSRVDLDLNVLGPQGSRRVMRLKSTATDSSGDQFPSDYCWFEFTNGTRLQEISIKAASQASHCPIGIYPLGTDSLRVIWNTDAIFPALQMINSGYSSDAFAPYLSIEGYRTGGEVVGGFIGGIFFSGNNSASAQKEFGGISCNVIDPTAGSEDARIVFNPVISGTETNVLQIANGVIIGAPTGSFQGNGTLNVAVDIFKNGGAYANPDFVLEKNLTGKIEKFADNEGAKEYEGILPLENLKEYLAQNLKLPGISNEPMGAFARSDKVLEKIEEAWLYILQLHERIRVLEEKLAG